MDKVLIIDGAEVGFRASALTPRLYRHKFHRDIIRDLNQLRKSFRKVLELPEDATDEEKQDAQLEALNLEIFENVTYIMAKQYDGNVPSDPDQWLDSFSTFSIYQILPHILQLWDMQQATTSIPKNA